MNRSAPFLPSHKQIQGATLIEVMISVFLLTFGVLGLMAAQIRSVAGVNEAESRTTISQAAETLAEAMQINTSILKEGSLAVRRYNNYTNIASSGKTIDFSNTDLPAPLWGADASAWDNATATAPVNAITKATVAQSHLSLFEHMLKQTPNAQTIQYSICEDNSNPPAPPTVDATTGTVNWQCNGGGNNQTAIKVVWSTRPANETAAPIYHSYQLQIAR